MHEGLNTEALQRRREEGAGRLAAMREMIRRQTVIEEGLAGSPHSLRALEHGVHDAQVQRIIAALPNSNWFVTLTLPVRSDGRTRITRETAEDMLRRVLYWTNKWLFGNAFRKGTRELTVVSCFELGPIDQAPHFHLILENPVECPRAPMLANRFLRRWRKQTGAAIAAQRMELERVGKESALRYLFKHTDLGHNPRLLQSTGQHIGQFDALNTRY